MSCEASELPSCQASLSAIKALQLCSSAAWQLGSYTFSMDSKKKASPGDSQKHALEAKLKALEAELKKMTELAARAQADLQNAKQRMTKDREELGRFASEGFLRKLLPTIESFRRAWEHLPVDLVAHEWVKGMTAIEQQLMKALAESGLKRMASLGAPVDPVRHEVLMTGPGPEGKVTEVFEEGYDLHGRVLRPAKVKAGDGSVAGSSGAGNEAPSAATAPRTG